MKTQDPLAIFYNQQHLTEISTRGYYPEKIKFICDNLKKLSQAKKIKILDIACNDGYLTKLYSEYGDIVGIDLNKKSVERCRKRGIECILGDIKDIPSKYAKQFDVVIAGDIIEHIFNTDEFLLSIKSLLKPNAVLLLTTANVASIGRRVMLLLGKNPFLEYSTKYPNVSINVGHIRYYTVEDMSIQLSGLGFKNVNIYGDKINITSKISIPYAIAKHFSTIARYMFVKCNI